MVYGLRRRSAWNLSGVCARMAVESAAANFGDGMFTYIIQELMTGDDCDADVYVDCVIRKP